MTDTTSFPIDPLFSHFFERVQYLYWHMPINPYRLFLGPVSTRELFFGRICYYFVLLSQFILLILYTLFLVKSIKSEDILNSAGTFVWVLLDIIVLYFTYFSWNKSREVAALLKQLHDIFPIDERGRDIAKLCANNWAWRINLQTIIFNTTVCGMLSTPILWSLVGYIQNGVWINLLPLKVWFPFDPLQIPMYHFVYLLEMWLYAVNLYIIPALGAILGGVTMMISVQFQIVANKFRNIEFENEKDDLLALEGAVKYHNETLEISTKISALFSVPLLIIFVLSSMVTCVFLFLAVHGKVTSDRIQNKVNSVSFLLFCAFNSYYGNYLIDTVCTYNNQCC